MSDSGAKAALKGYRLQALYTLATILDSAGKNLTFQPEGKEDLAVYKDGKLVKAIQIKAHQANLSLSSFTPEKPESFFRRAASIINCQQAEVEVVSFGEIGSEIKTAWAGEHKARDSVQRKLFSHGFEESSCKLLLKKLKWKRMYEIELQKAVFEQLQNGILAGNPEHAFNLLISWLYKAAENQERITFADLRNRITAVGKFLSERTAHHKEWFISIAPIEIPTIGHKHRMRLEEEFYSGVATRYEHIVAELDVIRKPILDQIELAFKSGKQTVIVHGASGQGKSAIAFRFFHDYIPDEWRFQIKYIQNRKHASSISIALAEHLSFVNAELYIYIDVSPRNQEWIDLIRELTHYSNIKILVTIREEDLARQIIDDSELCFPASIDMSFNKCDAQKFYDSFLVTVHVVEV